MTAKRITLFLSEGLITELNTLYPNRAARRGMTPEQIWMEAGQRELIDFLTAALTDLDAEAISTL
jgi:hypothetical protein